MALTTQLREQHTALGALARTIAQRLDPATVSATAVELRAELVTFIAALDRHLKAEDGVLYPLLSVNDDPCIRRVAAAFVAEMSGLRPAFDLFCQTWNEGEIARRPVIFCHEARELIAALEDRIRRENRELYPLADIGASAQPLSVS